MARPKSPLGPKVKNKAKPPEKEKIIVFTIRLPESLKGDIHRAIQNIERISGDVVSENRFIESSIRWYVGALES